MHNKSIYHLILLTVSHFCYDSHEHTPKFHSHQHLFLLHFSTSDNNAFADKGAIISVSDSFLPATVLSFWRSRSSASTILLIAAVNCLYSNVSANFFSVSSILYIRILSI